MRDDVQKLRRSTTGERVDRRDDTRKSRKSRARRRARARARSTSARRRFRRRCSRRPREDAVAVARDPHRSTQLEDRAHTYVADDVPEQARYPDDEHVRGGRPRDVRSVAEVLVARERDGRRRETREDFFLVRSRRSRGELNRRAFRVEKHAHVFGAHRVVFAVFGSAELGRRTRRVDRSDAVDPGALTTTRRRPAARRRRRRRTPLPAASVFPGTLNPNALCVGRGARPDPKNGSRASTNTSPGAIRTVTCAADATSPRGLYTAKASPARARKGTSSEAVFGSSSGSCVSHSSTTDAAARITRLDASSALFAIAK